jgi:hypothetical protein
MHQFVKAMNAIDGFQNRINDCQIIFIFWWLVDTLVWAFVIKNLIFLKIQMNLRTVLYKIQF